ncbi:MAG: 5'-nucleotidase C-terminal domain-containing protein, partial [Caldilineales bacterium]|nr:5'-nucleotidase C-terminal domain-containing protein [Caldilineales bacterium]
LTYGDWFQIMPYADTIRLFWLKGRDLLRLLDDNAMRVRRTGEQPGERGFVHFSRELRYQIGLGSDRSEAHAVDAKLHGEPLGSNLDKMYLVAFPSHFRHLAIPWEAGEIVRLPVLLTGIEHWPVRDTGLFVRRELLAHIAIHRGVTVAGGARCDGRVQVVAESPVLTTVSHSASENELVEAERTPIDTEVI